MTTTEIYKKYYANELNYINMRISNLHNAEEIANDVFIKIDRLNKSSNTAYDSKKLGYRGKTTSLSTWIRTITNSLIIDFFRTDHSKRYQNVSDFVNTETGIEKFQFVDNENNEVDKIMENAELSAIMLNAFRVLKPKYRKIAVLYFLRDKQYNEISELCNVPMGTVKGMINRIREMLQIELKDVYNVRKGKVVECIE